MKVRQIIFFSNPDGEYNQSKNALQDQVKTLDKKLHFIDKQLSQNSPDSGEHLSFQERRVLLGEQKQLVKERKGIIKDIRRMSFRLGTYTMIKESKQGSRLSNEDAARMEALMHQVQNIAVARIAEVEAKESGESENKEDKADVDQLTILDDINIIDQGR